MRPHRKKPFELTKRAKEPRAYIRPVAVVRLEYLEGTSRAPVVINASTMSRLAGPFDSIEEAEAWAKGWKPE